MAEKLRHFLHVAGVQGISVAALSEKSGISKPTIYRYANGQGSPTVDAMKLIAEALGCTVRETFPEVYGEKADVPTVNITDTQPISTAKLAMQYGMSTREFNQALFRAGIQIQRSDGSYVVAGNFADMVTYKPVKTENGTVRAVRNVDANGAKGDSVLAGGARDSSGGRRERGVVGAPDKIVERHAVEVGKGYQAIKRRRAFAVLITLVAQG